MTVNPTRIIAETLVSANEKSGDPRLTFVNLVTAAHIAGQFIGLSTEEIVSKLREVEAPAKLIAAELTGGKK